MAEFSNTSNLDIIRAKHQELLEYTAENVDNINYTSINTFLENISAIGTVIDDPIHRADLRALIRYWASFLNDKIGHYPSVQLRPFDSNQPPSNSTKNFVDNIELANYILLEEIGRGGFSKVYLAKNSTTNEKVAIKIFAQEELKSNEFHEILLKNEEKAKKFDHPNILKIQDIGLAGEIAYIVMDYIPEGSLAERMKHWYWRPKLSEILSIALQIVSGLEYLHARDIIHRDIKPGNLLLSSENHVYISDFGLAQTIEHTYKNLVVGTPSYMAPETIKYPDKVDGKADIYSLGIVIYQIISGTPPFFGKAAQSIMRSQIQDIPPELTTIADIPKNVAEVVQLCLSKIPNERPSAPNLQKLLENLFIELSEEELDSRAHGFSSSPDKRPGVAEAGAHHTEPFLEIESENPHKEIKETPFWNKLNLWRPRRSQQKPQLSHTEEQTEKSVLGEPQTVAYAFSDKSKANLVRVGASSEAPSIINLPDNQSVTLGRSPQLVDEVIKDSRVSRLHCRIQIRGREYLLIDEGSVSGTYVNDNQVPRSGIVLHDGDIISIGPIKYRFEAYKHDDESFVINKIDLNPKAVSTPTLANLHGTEKSTTIDSTKILYSDELMPGIPVAILILKVDNSRENLHSIYHRERITIGRSPLCDLIISDTAISAQHVLIVHSVDPITNNSQIYLTDLASSNGVFVNNEKVIHTSLKNNDVIKLGTTEIIIKCFE